jgi:hypothetical protein
MATRTVHDPFLGKDVQISDRLVDRLRGKYASGPHLPNGKPEFGWRQFESPPIQHEAAARIEELEKVLRDTVVVMQAELASASCLSQTLHALDAAKAALGEK